MGVEEDLAAAQAAVAEKDAALKQLNTDMGALRQKNRSLESTVSQLSAASDGHEAALAQARMAGADEARNAMKGEQAKTLALAELRVLASRKLHDPDDAARFIDVAKIMGTDGAYDATAATTQLDELVTAKPYMAIGAGAPAPPGPPGPPGLPRGNGDGGVRPPGGGDPDAPFNNAIRAAAKR